MGTDPTIQSNVKKGHPVEHRDTTKISSARIRGWVRLPVFPFPSLAPRAGGVFSGTIASSMIRVQSQEGGAYGLQVIETSRYPSWVSTDP
jgi:hypothetical protein